MNREILFKAKAINRDNDYFRSKYKNGDWVYGLVTKLYDERFETLPAEMTDENGISRIEVDHNTICQYTGLTDKNGNKIWENDVVKKHFYTDYDACANSEEYIGKVEYLDCAWNITFTDENNNKSVYPMFMAIEFKEAEYYEVIGNIFDNPELMSGNYNDCIIKKETV